MKTLIIIVGLAAMCLLGVTAVDLVINPTAIVNPAARAAGFLLNPSTGLYNLGVLLGWVGLTAVLTWLGMVVGAALKTINAWASTTWGE